jgi:hypothetical protein
VIPDVCAPEWFLLAAAARVRRLRHRRPLPPTPARGIGAPRGGADAARHLRRHARGAAPRPLGATWVRRLRRACEGLCPCALPRLPRGEPRRFFVQGPDDLPELHGPAGGGDGGKPGRSRPAAPAVEAMGAGAAARPPRARVTRSEAGDEAAGDLRRGAGGAPAGDGEGRRGCARRERHVHPALRQHVEPELAVTIPITITSAISSGKAGPVRAASPTTPPAQGGRSARGGRESCGRTGRRGPRV